MALQQARRVTEAIQEEYRLNGKPNLDDWREQVEQARRESVNAYAGFIESLFRYYRDSGTR